MKYTDTTAETLIRHMGNIHNWALARNLIGGATPQAQFLKLTEEAGELDQHASQPAHTTYADDVTGAMDGLGDTIVVATIMAGQLGIDRAAIAVSVEAYMDGRDSSSAYLLGALSKLASALARGKAEEYHNALVAVIGEAIETYWQSFSDEVMAHSTIAEIKDDPGIGFVVNDAHLLDRCLTLVWSEIKDRQGVMYGGVFIKADDERYAGVRAELGLDA